MSTSGKAGGGSGGPPSGAAGGDIAGTGTSSYPNPTLTAIGAAAGPIGTALRTPAVTIDTKGRVTALTDQAIALAATGDATGTLPGALTLKNTGPGATGPLGTGTTVPVVTIDAQGRITALTSTAITPTAGIIAVGPTLISAAAIGTAFSAPTQLVAAPAANTAIHVIDACVEIVGGVGAWQAGGAFGLYYDVPGTGLGAGFVTTPDALQAAGPTSQFVGDLGGFVAPIGTGSVAAKKLVFASDTADPSPLGPIATATKQAGGAGYAAGDTGTITVDFFGPAATYVVNTVAAGAVATFTITSPGTGYSTAGNPITTATGGAQPGVGVGFTINVTALAALTTVAYVSLTYRLVTTH